MLDTTLIGTEFESHSAVVEEGRLRLFAKATDQRNPIYTDLAAARAAGYAALPAPPTFIWCLAMDRPDPLYLLKLLKVDISRVLHAGQSIALSKVAVAGEVLSFRSRITDIYHKKSGALGFVIEESEVLDQQGSVIGTMRNTGAVRLG